jgi:streptogramin lyase
MTRDAQGNLWFNVRPTTTPNHGGLARLDPRTEKIDVFVPPAGMSGTGGAVTVDVDGKGKIWASAPDGILRFDPDTQLFTEFKSPAFKTAHGTGITYGVAADRDGNGWWAQMALDIVDKADTQSGKSIAIELPPIAAEMARITPEEKQLYDSFAGLDFNTPFPWSQGPRRMGADKNGDTVWVCDFWGGSLARIDTQTGAAVRCRCQIARRGVGFGPPGTPRVAPGVPANSVAKASNTPPSGVYLAPCRSFISGV